MNKRVQEIIGETLRTIHERAKTEVLPPNICYAAELIADSKLPEELQGKIHFRIGLLKGQLVMGYQDGARP